jgi:hypothetical protein
MDFSLKTQEHVVNAGYKRVSQRIYSSVFCSNLSSKDCKPFKQFFFVFRFWLYLWIRQYLLSAFDRMPQIIA